MYYHTKITLVLNDVMHCVSPTLEVFPTPGGHSYYVQNA